MWSFKHKKNGGEEKKNTRKDRKKPRPFQFEALEPRLLLSADIGLPVVDMKAIPGLVAPVIAEASVNEKTAVQAGDNLNPGGNGNGAGDVPVETTVLQTTDNVSDKNSLSSQRNPQDVQTQTPSAAPGIDGLTSGAKGIPGSDIPAPVAHLLATDNRREVVIVDPSVPNYQSFVDALIVGEAAGRTGIPAGSSTSGSTVGDPNNPLPDENSRYS
jgi:hypothetical protein